MAITWTKWYFIPVSKVLSLLFASKIDLKAWEVCSKNLIKITPEDTVLGAIQLMVENKVNHVLVMTGDYLEGIISSFDVLKEIIKNE